MDLSETRIDHISTAAPAVEARGAVIMQVLPALETGGVERGTVDITAAISAAGWHPVVVSSGGQMVREIERAGGVHCTLPVHSKSPFVMRANVKRLAALIREHGVDIVHARSRAPAWSARAAARRTGCHFVTTFHGGYGARSFFKRRYNAIMTRGERVIAISHYIADHMQSVYRTDPERIRVIHRGVDLDIFDAAAVSPERLIQTAKEWNLADGMPVILLPGRLSRRKGQAVFIDALSRLGRRDVRCIIVGTDRGRSGYREEIEERARRAGLSDVVQIVGNCRDMPAAYINADVVVSAPIEPEGFGRIAAEAQAMGRPIITTDIGAAREVVRDGETGWLVPPGDAEALAVALAEAIAMSTSEREAMAARSAAHVRANFSRQAMCANTLAVYEEVLAREIGRAHASAA